MKNPLATTPGIIVVGAVIGLIAVWLQKLGNPANMGICVACFERDVAGGLGLHRAAIVQYLRPEIMGLVLGSLAAALATREFKPRGGSAPLVRFVLGIIAAMGALVFLGCPWRAILRLAGGDGNAILGLAGLATGIWIGTLFFKRGYSLGRSNGQSAVSGALFPALIVGLLLLYLVFPQIPGEPQSGPLFYSVKGPGSQHAPFIASLGLAFVIGIIAQRSRFCTMGAFRDLFLFRYTHLFLGLAAMFAAAFVANALTGGLKFGFEGQPVAHSDFVWNYLGMVTAGLAFALAGGCPGRQLFMAGEGDSDAALFALGMLVGAALAHNLGTASSGTGIGVYGVQATLIGFAVCLVIGFIHSRKA
ncbi:MAG TPA: YedE-related selenium metabolism membrane protein [Candidatus Bilophila faecipullorum]|uniref:YedE-related selenium metabolism membrane protein n=1 Tax=Candidatus Bilophila faecipullorum TaxID=2838482 RepID=A0A9D1U973_9BACT|nr:YedE family putative selenium transporter [uncultured Bilophila sp.]HIW77880.1 YedE-related selenium metabolism membrane protein [Candidatus Bilophila faecipullorum]